MAKNWSSSRAARQISENEDREATSARHRPVRGRGLVMGTGDAHGSDQRLRASADPAPNPVAHTRAKPAVLDLQLPGLCETRTVRWREMDSNL